MAIVFLVVVIDLIGFGIIIPLLPFFGEYFNASPEIIGCLMATYSAGQLLTAPLWGRLSDKIGRRPVLLVSLFGLSLSYLLMSSAQNLLSLFIARALGGLMAGNISAAFAYVADITTPQNRAKGMGLIGAAFGIGFIIGPAIGGILAGSDPAHANYQMPALIAAIASGLAFVISLIFLSESLTPEMRFSRLNEPTTKIFDMFRQAISQKELRVLLIVSFLVIFVFASLESMFPIWSRRAMAWGPEQTGYLFAFVGIISAIIQGGFLGFLTKLFGEIRLIIMGTLILAIGMALVPLSNSVELLTCTMALVAIGFSLVSPSLNTAISLRSSATEQGQVMGITRSVTTFSRILGPAWAGLIFGSVGKNWPFFLSALIMVFVLALLINIWRPKKT